MAPILQEQTVGDLAREHPQFMSMFDRLGIDYCCGGKVSLEEACRRRGLHAPTVCQVLSAAAPSVTGGENFDADRASLHQLIERIKTTHHAFLRRELPRLRDLLGRVDAAHAEKHHSLHELVRVFAQFEEELTAHMHKEEFVLFPMIDRLESTGQSQRFHCGSLHNPIGVMELEHESAGAAMERMRELTDNYTPPADACATWRALLAGLSAMEADMHQHVHKENNILFPKALALEAALAAPQAAGAARAGDQVRVAGRNQ